MSKITQKHQALVEEHPNLLVLLNPVPLCRHFPAHWGTETWGNERSYSTYDFMVYWDSFRKPGDPNTPSGSQEDTADSPPLGPASCS